VSADPANTAWRWRWRWSAVIALSLGALACDEPHRVDPCADLTCSPVTNCDPGAKRCVAPDEVPERRAEQSPSLALSSKGEVYLAAYAKEGGDLLFGVWDPEDARVRYQVVDSLGDVGRSPSLALFADDRPAIAYYDASNHHAKFAYLDPEGRWRTEIIDATASVGAELSLTIATDDVAHVAYRDLSHRALRYAKRQEGIWQIEFVDTGSDRSLPPAEQCPAEQRERARRGLGFGVRIVAQGSTPLISYHDGDCGSLRLARKSASAWTVQVVDGWDRETYRGATPEPLTRVGRFSDLGVDLKGTVAVAYTDHTEGTLKVARFPAGVPTIEVADDGLRWQANDVVIKHVVGQMPTLAFEGETLVVIHQDARHRHLVLSRRLSDRWRHTPLPFATEGFNPDLVIAPGRGRYLAAVNRTATARPRIEVLALP